MSVEDARQRRLAADALAALSHTDFALAGSGAIREHGISDRPTQDVGLFTASVDPELFSGALNALKRSLSDAGYTVHVLRRAPVFARLQVRTPDGGDLEVDLGADWRSAEPTRTAIGPVLGLEDAVGSKIDALYGRAESRDFLDADAIRRSGRFTDEELLAIVGDRDPGFNRGVFAAQLDQVRELSAAEVARYNVTADELAEIQDRLTAWSRTLRESGNAEA